MDKEPMKDNERVVIDAIQHVWNKGEYDRIPEFYAEDCKHEGTALTLWPWHGDGLEGIKRHVMEQREVFPDYHEEPQIVFSDGDMVAIRQLCTGTHVGGTRFPPTGKKVSYLDMMFCRVRDGKIVEQWGMFDQYWVLVQFGLIEPIQPQQALPEGAEPVAARQQAFGAEA